MYIYPKGFGVPSPREVADSTLNCNKNRLRYEANFSKLDRIVEYHRLTVGRRRNARYVSSMYPPFCVMRIGQIRIAIYVERTPNQKPLYLFATFARQDQALLLGFNALSDHGHSQIVPQADNCPYDGCRILVATKIRYEFAVDLDLIERKGLQGR